MLLDRGAVAPSVRQCHDQPDLPSDPFGERRALELCRSQLGLQVEQRPLDLNLDRFDRTRQHDVRGPAIGECCNWHLEAQLPARVRGRPNLLGQAQLSGVPQSDAIGREESQGEVMAGRRRQSPHHLQAGDGATAFNLADEGLADPCAPGHLRLTEARHGSGSHELAGESRGGQLGALSKAWPDGWHDDTIVS